MHGVLLLVIIITALGDGGERWYAGYKGLAVAPVSKHWSVKPFVFTMSNPAVVILKGNSATCMDCSQTEVFCFGVVLEEGHISGV